MSTIKVEGKITSIKGTEKFPTHSPPYWIYTASIQSTTGDLYKVYLATNKAGYQEGQMVNLELEKGKYGQYNIVSPSNSNINNTTSNINGNTTGVTGSNSNFNKRVFPLEPDSPEMSIVRQSCLKTAVETYRYIDGDKRPSDVKDIAELIISIAYDYVDFCSGRREIKMLADRNVKNIKNNE